MGRITRLRALAAWHGSVPARPLRDNIKDLIAERQAAEDRPSGNLGTSGEPFTLPRRASAERDIAYGGDPAQKLDVYRPANASGAPVIFLVHGGGWGRGDKGNVRAVKNKVIHWVGKGCLLISVNYRVLPQARPVEQADDVAKALSYAQANVRAWGGDPSRFLLMGHSAGAHLVSLISADPTIATRLGAKPWQGSISIDSAAFDVVEIMRGRHLPLYDKAWGKNPDYWREGSPTHRLTGRLSAPLLAVCSSRRSDACAQARAFATKAEAMGGTVSVLPVDLSHMEANDQLGAPGDYTAGVDAFIRSVGLL